MMMMRDEDDAKRLRRLRLAPIVSLFEVGQPSHGETGPLRWGSNHLVLFPTGSEARLAQAVDDHLLSGLVLVMVGDVVVLRLQRLSGRVFPLALNLTDAGDGVEDRSNLVRARWLGPVPARIGTRQDLARETVHQDRDRSG